MRALAILRLRLRTLLHSRRLDRELEEELAYHLDRDTERHLAGGLSASEARAAARLSLGPAAILQEDCRDARRAHWIAAALTDLQAAWRDLRRTPAFAALVIAPLALGIGGNTAVFSVADALLFRALPVPDPARLFQALQPDGPGLWDYGELFSAADFPEMRDRVAPFAALAAQTEIRRVPATIGSAHEQPLRRQSVSDNYFDTLAVNPALGSTFSNNGGANPPALLSYAFWETRLSRDPAVIGQTLRIGKSIYRIAGVAPPGFFGTELGASVDIWTPLSSESPAPRNTRSIRVLGRLLPAATIDQAFQPLQTFFHRQMQAMAARAPQGMPESLLQHIRSLQMKLVPAGSGISRFRAGNAAPLLILFGLVGLVLLSACATVATLFEARRPHRQGELAVRLSLGASRWRILRQLFCEALLLAAAAAALGLLLARSVSPALVKLLAAAGAPLDLPTAIDSHVLFFTAATGILTALAFGLLPAWQSSAVNPIGAIRAGYGRTSSRAFGSKATVAVQVAVSLVLVLGASAFVRTLVNLTTAESGFDRRNLVVADLQFADPSPAASPALAWQELLRRVASLRGVESAGLASGSPFDGAFGNGMLRVPRVAPNTNLGVIFFLASAGFFRTTGIPRIEGRDFSPSDFAPGAPPVAIVSQTLARSLFAGASPVGRTFANLEDSPPRWVTVIGVAGDTRYESLRNSPARVVYYPYTWPRPVTAMSIVLRATRDVASLRPVLAREAAAASPALTLRRITTQTKLIDDTLVRERLLASVAALFGGLSILMAVIGLYAVASYAVAQRTTEIGIRMALGAAQTSVVAMVLHESLVVAATGGGIGLALSFVAGRWLSAMLFGVRLYDGVTLVTAAVVLLTVTGASTFLPARRAAKTDPVAALRDQ